MKDEIKLVVKATAMTTRQGTGSRLYRWLSSVLGTSISLLLDS